jgi:hypothetical protein
MKYSPILVLHILGAIVGLVFGYAALFLRKGSRAHRWTGNVFFVSMLVMSLSGAYMAAFVKPNMGNVFGGVLTFYLVGAGWLTVMRKEKEAGLVEFALFLVVLAEGIGGLVFGREAAMSATGLKDGYPAMMYFVFGCLALLFAGSDVRMFVRGGVAGAQRIARHLWRMGFALLIAAASLFLGKQQHFPEAIRNSPILNTPILLVAVMMIFWLVRVRFTGAYRKARKSAGPVVALGYGAPRPEGSKRTVCT